MKKCKIEDCEGYHEGYCIIDEIYEGANPKDCNAKTSADLMSEEEFEYMMEKKSKLLE